MTQILGSMRRLDENVGVVRVEDIYDTDIADLWSALTEPPRLARWMAEVHGEPKLGESFDFLGVGFANVQVQRS